MPQFLPTLPPVETDGSPQSKPPAEARSERTGTGLLRTPSRPFLRVPSFRVPSWSDIENSARELLAGPALAPDTLTPEALQQAVAGLRENWK